MTPLPLTPDQIRVLQETGEVETWTKMEPQPDRLKGWDEGARVKVQPGRWVSVTELIHYANGHPEILPHPIGTQAWVQEEWAAPVNWNRVKAIHLESWIGCWWKAHPNRPLSADELLWRPASDMPQWASRFNIVSTAVRVERRDGVWGFCTTWRKA